jgi:hypothetical protein
MAAKPAPDPKKPKRTKPTVLGPRIGVEVRVKRTEPRAWEQPFNLLDMSLFHAQEAITEKRRRPERPYPSTGV